MQLYEWTNVVGIKLCEITQKKAAGVKFKKKKTKSLPVVDVISACGSVRTANQRWLDPITQKHNFTTSSNH